MQENLPVFKVYGTLDNAELFSFCPAVSAEEAEAGFRFRNPGVKNVYSEPTEVTFHKPKVA